MSNLLLSEGKSGKLFMKRDYRLLKASSELPREAFPDKEYIEKVWLKYYNMNGPLTSASIFLSHDP
uniref:Uncharacterized protein n=1 Tax=Romanomermis culicivorax TaxID=13658 RepID=A0A915IUK2_ROMCU